MTTSLTRRAWLGGAFVAAAVPAAAETRPPRLVALDWGLASTAIALGVTPVGIAERRLYRDWVGEPAIPAGVAEVGLRGSPSFETLTGLAPDLILVNLLDAPILGRLERIAPTWMNTVFDAERAPLRRAREAALALGTRLGRTGDAEALIGRADGAVAAARSRIRRSADRRVVPVSAIDGRHLTVYGQGSLFHDVLGALGLPAVATGPTSHWGTRTIPVADLATLMPADLLVIAPVGADARAAMDGPGLWRSLLAAGGGRAILTPPAWAYGDIGAAGRFAGLVADALTGTQA